MQFQRRSEQVKALPPGLFAGMGLLMWFEKL